MERQSFEDPQAAAVVNERFVCVKVDREERPDVDDIYMMAVQVMTGHGGWPMSVFLTPPGAGGEQDPGLKPFYTGTYFPPETGHGLPSFTQVVESLGQAWVERREDVLSQAEQIADAVREQLGRRDQPGEVNAELVRNAANSLLRSYDSRHGGFGGSPKFPTPSNLLFLLAVHRNNPNNDIGQAIAHTLDRMARGGMYDQIGGGFHRYSTDERWLVPHFEKMLYDNGQLLETYARAQAMQLSVGPADEAGLYQRIMRQTCEYVLREMSDPTGMFWSAQDAEVDAREGGNYLWQPAEMSQAVNDAKLAELANHLYGLDLGSNFQDPHHADSPPANVLFLPQSLPQVAQERGMTLEALLSAKEMIDRRLLEVREKRKQPGTDDKVLVAWNGMMIAGMALAGKALDESRYWGAAAKAAQAILSRMRAENGGLFRTARQGQAKIPAFLDDYALLAHGLVELHRATGEPRWLTAAQEIMAGAEQRFAAQPAAVGEEGGGYFDTLADQADLFVRTRSAYDGAIPSGNSQMVHNLLDLFDLTHETKYLDRAGADLRSFAAALRRAGAGMPHMHAALLRYLELSAGREGTSSAGKTADPVGGEIGRGATGRRQPVRVSVEPERVDLHNGPAAVAVTLRIHPEYHLTAHDPGEEGLIPTELRLENVPGWEVEARYPTGKQRRYAFADRPLAVYEDTVVLHATIRRKQGGVENAGVVGGPPRLMLRYQVCTDQTCLEPRDEELPIKVVGAD